MPARSSTHDDFGTDRVAKPTPELQGATQLSPPLATLINEHTGQIHPLLAEITLIGRDKTCGIVVREDNAVSRKHAQVRRKGVSFLLEDLASSNGVYVNGQKLTTAYELQVGDLVEIGAQVYMFKRRA